MTICTNCMKIFLSDDELENFVEFIQPNGKIIQMPYDFRKEYPQPFEVFSGCPNCRTDAYLMDRKEV